MLRPLTIFSLLVVLSTMTVKRNFAWQDEVTIWRDSSLKSPRRVRPHNNLGNALRDDAGRPVLAISEYRAAINIAPFEVPPRHNLSVAYIMLEMYEEAEKELHFAIQLMPENHVLHGNLGFVYLKKGLFDEAEREFETALDIKPDYRMARDNLVWLRWRKGPEK
ncbi:MAG: tetratricopeptide repeat protein [Planctomycetota bacterium]|jgi:Flp pilus assembly protein TadD